MSKKIEDKWLQVGNFLLGVEKNRNGLWFVVKTVSGSWQLRYGSDTLMFAQMTSLAADAGCHPYLESLLTFQYAATNYPHDLASIVERQTIPVMNGFAKLLNEQADFEVSVSQKHTEQEEEAALKEVAEMQDIQDELEHLDEGVQA